MDKEFIIKMSVLTLLAVCMLATCIGAMCLSFKWFCVPGFITMGACSYVIWNYAVQFVKEWRERKSE